MGKGAIMPRSSPCHTQRSVWHIEAETRRRRTCRVPTHSHVWLWQEYQYHYTSPGPGGKTSTCSTWEKNNFCSLANQTESKWIGARIHLQWLSLAVDNGCPAGYCSKGSQSTPSKVRMKGFLVGEFWFEDKGRLVGGRENGQAAKSPHVVYLVLSEDVEVHNDPPPLSPIFHTKMLPDQIYWDKTLTKALVDNELKH